jgi:hypothetical protein
MFCTCPSALLKTGSDPALLSKASRIISSDCSLESGIIYEREIDISWRDFLTYIGNAYGAQSWIEVKAVRAYFGRDASTAELTLLRQTPVASRLQRRPMRVIIVRSSYTRMWHCKRMLRGIFQRKGDPDMQSSCHSTDTHSQAIRASQMLLHHKFNTTEGELSDARLKTPHALPVQPLLALHHDDAGSYFFRTASGITILVGLTAMLLLCRSWPGWQRAATAALDLVDVKPAQPAP